MHCDLFFADAAILVEGSTWPTCSTRAVLLSARLRIVRSRPIPGRPGPRPGRVWGSAGLAAACGQRRPVDRAFPGLTPGGPVGGVTRYPFNATASRPSSARPGHCPWNRRMTAVRVSSRLPYRHAARRLRQKGCHANDPSRSPGWSPKD